ncbi:MAG: Trm112 family protein [Paucibacter sp.]|nr:Trm112 family protein [Roseateles sp.]
MDNRLLEMLVCPLCKGPLELKRLDAMQELICYADRLAFPVRDGIPLMLENEARAINPETETRTTRPDVP